MTTPLPPIACVGAIYTGSERGLVADALAASASGLAPYTVCTSIVAASHDRVTDLTEVPSDTVRSQLEHLTAVTSLAGAKIGILGSDRNAQAVLEWAANLAGPVVLEVVASGPSGETVLPARGIDEVAEHLVVADLVTISRTDAELVTGGEIASLDDAQVAAQRIANRGARGVLIHCGQLPARFYDAADDPGGGEAAASFVSDLYFDGEDFALFERPIQLRPEGIDSMFAITALSRLVQTLPIEEALQAAVQAVVESARAAQETADGGVRIAYDWRSQHARTGS